jgi:hypothetical protein
MTEFQEIKYLGIPRLFNVRAKTQKSTTERLVMKGTLLRRKFMKSGRSPTKYQREHLSQE